ncbi:MAG: Lsr2 family protein [Actinomycetales bacterium]|nr:Lsr2 family protein [Actinomycetales bacterium]
MSSSVQILLKDDLDGTPAEETLQFMLDGTTYEIDLSKRNAAALRQAMARYVKAARRVRIAAGAGRAVSANGSRTRTTATAAGAGRGRPAGRRKAAPTKKGRAVTAGARRRTSTASARVRKAAGTGANPAAVREWARKQGIAVSERGRIASEVVAKFELARKG